MSQHYATLYASYDAGLPEADSPRSGLRWTTSPVPRLTQRALAAQNQQLLSLQTFKDEMSALVVHDLKSPLSSIAMNLEVALSALPADDTCEDARAALEDCRTATTRLFRMIANLLDITKNEDGCLLPKIAPVDVGSLVDKVTRDHALDARLRRIDLTVERNEGSAAVMADIDPDLLGRVLENLVENALRFTRAEGQIRLVAREIDNAVELCVKNDGAAVNESVRARIFEKYNQGQQNGATQMNRGLGLYFCRIAVEAHGGTIVLAEEEGFPTVFRITIPRRAPATP